MASFLFIGQSALHESCSYFNTSQFQAERANFQNKVREQIVLRYEELHADITDLQVFKLLVILQYNSKRSFYSDQVNISQKVIGLTITRYS